MKIINVSGSFEALVDDEDFERASKIKWWILRDPCNLYASANVKRDGKWTTIKLHRFIVNAVKGEEVDHIDGNGLNNQKSNLRKCTRSQNKQHQRKTTNQFGFKGVTFDPRKQNRQYQARVRSMGKTWNCGFHNTPEEAARAYNIMAIEKFGEYASLNKV